MSSQISVPAAGIQILNAQWQDWLTSNIVAGCIDDDLLATMKDSGFDSVFAKAAISVVRSMTQRVQSSNPELLEGFFIEPLYLPKPLMKGLETGNNNYGYVRLADRECSIVFSLSSPNVAVIDGILSDKECDQLIQLSKSKLKRSEVIDRATGGNQVSLVRTSEGAHFELGENAVVQALEKRIAALTGSPVENGEPLQILHYGVGGEYLAHHDYFDPADPGSKTHLDRGGQRIATMVLYLNDVPLGGGTGFPEIEMTVRARKGSCVYFEYCNQHNQLDNRLLHAGLPVVKGDKWIATKWIRVGRYG
jgi:prolyl 4-hydroxylase